MEDLKTPIPANSPPLTPLIFLERAATAYPDRPSLIHNDTIVSTWSSTHTHCLRLASSLVHILNVRPNDVVSAFLPNLPAMYNLQFAVPMTGAVLNNLNTRLDSRSLASLLSHSRSVALFLDFVALPLILDALSLLPASLPRPALIVVHDDQDSRLRGTVATSNHDCYDYEELVGQGDPEFRWVRPGSEWDPIVLNYTSGTTSHPKGVVHSHRAVFVKTMDSIINWPLGNGAVYLWTLPMFHANGWSFPWAMAAVGGTNVCMRRFDTEKTLMAIRRHKVTHMCGAPVILNMLANEGAEQRRRLDAPVHIQTAGAPPPAEVLKRAEEMGFVVSHGYGLTETAGVVVTCAWQDKWDLLPLSHRARLKSRQGIKSIGLTDMDVIDTTTGNSVTRDGKTVGEVILRGATLMLGYLKDPDGTKNTMTPSGYFLTGDVGVMHPDNYLEIKDRSKDVIISGGENISSVEVESVLYTNPAVNEAAVVARPDEHWGESPCAFVSLKGDLERAPDEEEIIEYCRANMPHYMVPRTVVFKEELPKTATGKIQKFVLRDAARGMGPRVVVGKVVVKATRGGECVKLRLGRPSVYNMGWVRFG